MNEKALNAEDAEDAEEVTPVFLRALCVLCGKAL
jgi:hypothetical protein